MNTVEPHHQKNKMNTVEPHPDLWVLIHLIICFNLRKITEQSIVFKNLDV